MFKKFLLLTALIATLAFAATALKADELPADSMARFLRPDTFMYVEMRDLGATIERAKGLALTKMLEDPEIQVFIDSLMAVARDEAGEENDFEAGREIFTKAIQVFSGEITLSMPAISKDDKNPGLIITSGFMPENKVLVVDLLKEIKNFIFEKQDAEFHEAVVEAEGYAINMFKRKVEDNDAKSVCYVLTEKHAILTIGFDTIKTFITDMRTPPQQSLANNAKFLKLYNSVHSQDMFWYYDNNQYMNLMDDAFAMIRQMPVVGRLFDKFKDFTAFSGTGVSIDGPDFVEESMTLFSRPNTPLARALADTRSEMKTAALMPKESLMYMSFGIPSENLAELFDSMVGENRMPENIANFENNMMLSIKDDLLPALGSEIGMYMSMQFLVPEFMVAVELKNPDIIAQALQDLEMLMPGGVTEFEFRGHKIYSVSGKGVPGIQFAATVKDNYLLIGLISTIKNAIIREENLAENQIFIDAKRITGTEKVSGFIFLDVESLVGFAYDNAMPFLQSALAQFPQFDPMTIPSRNALVANLRPIATSFNYTGDGSMTKTKGLVPVMAVSLIQVLIQGMRITTVPEFPEDAPPDLF